MKNTFTFIAFISISMSNCNESIRDQRQKLDAQDANTEYIETNIGSGVSEIEIAGWKTKRLELAFGVPSSINILNNISDSYLGKTAIRDSVNVSFEKEYIFKNKSDTVVVLTLDDSVVRAFRFWSSY